MHARLSRIRPQVATSSGIATNRPEHRRLKRVAAAVSLLCLAAGPAHAELTQMSGGGLVWDSSGPTSYDTFDINAPTAAPLTYGSPSVTSANVRSWAAAHVGGGNMYASASPALQTLRSSSAASSIGGTENGVSSQSLSSRHEVYVGAGTSGLNIGDAITLQFTLRVDGRMALGNTAYPTGVSIALPAEYGYAASASEAMRYEVYDLNVDPSEFVLNFEHNAYATYGYSKDQFGDVLTDTLSAYGRYTGNSGTTYTNLAGVSIDNTVSPVPLHDAPFASPPGVEHAIDTGYVTISLDTVVGHTLSIVGQLDTHAAGWGDLRMYGLSDFASTFDAEVSTSVAGVELLGLQSGIAPVPEADAWAMLLAGLGLTAAAARRRRQSWSEPA